MAVSHHLLLAVQMVLFTRHWCETIAQQTATSDRSVSTTTPPPTNGHGDGVGDGFLSSLAELCAGQRPSTCVATAQFCSSRSECPANHVCSCVKGCARLQCTLVQGSCSPLPAPQNGYGIQYGDVMHFGCDDVYTLFGPARKECQNGIWIPASQYPRCVRTGVKEADICAARPCQNGGSCLQSDVFDDGFVCACPIGFDGQKCENAWLKKSQYLGLLDQVAELRQRLNAMSQLVENCKALAPSCSTDKPTSSTRVNTATTVVHAPQVTTTVAGLRPEGSTIDGGPTDIVTSGQDTSLVVSTAPKPVVFRWPGDAVDETKLTPTSLVLCLPLDICAAAQLVRVVLLRRQYLLELQDWSPWTKAASSADGNICSAPVTPSNCSKHTVTSLRPLTSYQFAISVPRENASLYSLSDFDVLEARTPAEGAPIWPEAAFILVESSPDSATIRLPKVSAAYRGRVSYYTAAYRQRRSGAWAVWNAAGGRIPAGQERLKIAHLIPSIQLQVVVTSHARQPQHGSNGDAVQSSALNIQLPEEIYMFQKTPIAAHEVQRESMILHLPRMPAEHNVTDLAIYLRALAQQPDTYHPWRAAVRLPISINKYIIRGLQPGQAYQLRARARSSTQGPLRYSSVHSFATHSLDTPVWGSVAIADRTPTSITVNVPKVDRSQASVVQYYIVSYHGVGPRSPNGWQPGAGPLRPSVTTATVSGLLPGTRYDIRVRAVGMDRGETMSAVLPSSTLDEDAPLWLTTGLDETMARSSSIVINVPVVRTANTRYLIYLRRWLLIGPWADWSTVMNFTIGAASSWRVRTSRDDNGRKYIPVRLGPLVANRYYQIMLQYQYQPSMRLSPLSSTRTTKTLVSGIPVWVDRPVLSATATTAKLRMPRVLAGFVDTTTHYTVEYRFVPGHTMEPLSVRWRHLGTNFTAQQETLNMINLPAGATVEVRVRAHNQTGTSEPSPPFRVLLPLQEDLGEPTLPETKSIQNPTISPLDNVARSVLRLSCQRLCCGLAKPARPAGSASPCSAQDGAVARGLPASHVCLTQLEASFCVQRYAECCSSPRG